jgi:hypothetical protein
MTGAGASGPERGSHELVAPPPPPADAPRPDGREAHRARADAAFRSSSRLIDRSMLLMGLGALVGSVLMSPDPDVLTLFGYEIPVMCGFRALTGQECMGCGLTRSFAYMGHLQPMAAFGMHKAGPLAFVFLAGQVPYRAWKLWRYRPR